MNITEIIIINLLIIVIAGYIIYHIHYNEIKKYIRYTRRRIRGYMVWKTRARLITAYHAYNLVKDINHKSNEKVKYKLVEDFKWKDMLYSDVDILKPWLFLDNDEDKNEFWMVQNKVAELRKNGYIKAMCKLIEDDHPQPELIESIKKGKPYSKSKLVNLWNLLLHPMFPNL